LRLFAAVHGSSRKRVVGIGNNSAELDGRANEGIDHNVNERVQQDFFEGEMDTASCKKRYSAADELDAPDRFHTDLKRCCEFVNG
jgi:hypothetical protein